MDLTRFWGLTAFSVKMLKAMTGTAKNKSEELWTLEECKQLE